jgi:hypothetical protein
VSAGPFSALGTKVLLKPSAKNVRALLDKVDKILRGKGGHGRVGLLIEQLDLILRGWALSSLLTRQSLRTIELLLTWPPVRLCATGRSPRQQSVLLGT